MGGGREAREEAGRDREAPETHGRARHRGPVPEAPSPRPAPHPARTHPPRGAGCRREEAHRCRGLRARWAAPCGSSRTSRRPGGRAGGGPRVQSLVRIRAPAARGGAGAALRLRCSALPLTAGLGLRTEPAPPTPPPPGPRPGPPGPPGPPSPRPATASEWGPCLRPHSAHWLRRHRPRPLVPRPRPRPAPARGGPGRPRLEATPRSRPPPRPRRTSRWTPPAPGWAPPGAPGPTFRSEG